MAKHLEYGNNHRRFVAGKIANMKSDIEIAKEATLRPIAEIARMAGIAQEHISPYGRQIAKIDLGYLQIQPQRPNAKL
ncbi:MAG: formate--tetrahydrofolate ligase, partial [Pseudomonadota bacterium]